jgi:hypothetical protein
VKNRLLPIEGRVYDHARQADAVGRVGFLHSVMRDRRPQRAVPSAPSVGALQQQIAREAASKAREERAAARKAAKAARELELAQEAGRAKEAEEKAKLEAAARAEREAAEKAEREIAEAAARKAARDAKYAARKARKK